MRITEKIKTINNEVEQIKTQYNLDKKTAKIFALSSGNVIRYEFLFGKDVLLEKEVLEITPASKRFECSPLGKELKLKASVAEKQYQNFDQVLKPDEIEQSIAIKKEQPLTIKNEITDKSSLVYDRKYSFAEYRNVGKYYNLSFKTKCDRLLLFYH